MPPPSDRPTTKPPRPSTKRFLRSGADSRKVDEAQARILEGLHDGVTALIDRAFADALGRVRALVDRFFGDAREVVRGALLHAGLDLYNEGKARGHAEAATIFGAHARAAHGAYAAMVRDPRAEVVPPAVTLAALHTELVTSGASDLSPEELAKLCEELRLTLAKPDEDG